MRGVERNEGDGCTKLHERAKERARDDNTLLHKGKDLSTSRLLLLLFFFFFLQICR